MTDWWQSDPIASQASAGGANWWQGDPLADNSTFGERLADVWANPTPGSIFDIAKKAVEFVQLPNRVLAGQFSPQPETPGILTEEDVFRQDAAKQALINQAASGATVTMMSQAPGGVFAAPRGSLGMGFARPGQPVAPRTAEAGAPPVPPGAVPPAAGAPPVPPGGPGAVAPEVVEAATRIDVPIPRYMVDESRMTQGLAAGLQNIPGVGDKIAKSADVTVKALGTAADRVKEGFGVGSPAVAGSYAKDALVEWMTEGSKKVANRVYDAVDNMVNPQIASELPATARAAQQILTERAASKIPGDSAAVKTVLDAVTTPGGLNYPGIKGLRSFLGEMTPEEIVTQGFRGTEVKRLYGAMTQDLRASVLASGGPKALTAFNKANSIFENIASRREALAKIIGVKGDAAPEAVFSRLLAMAGSKTTADIGRLNQARKAMGPEAWNEVASAVVARLGRDPQGEFSIQRFLTAHGNLSSAGKTTLFASTGKDNLARSLDDIAFVTKSIEDKLKQFYNPSGTARSLVSTGTALAILHSPIKMVSIIIGGNRLAEIYSEPATARAAADWMKAYHAAIIAPSAKANKATRDAAEKLAGIITQRWGGDAAQLAAQLEIRGELAAAAPPPKEKLN